MLKKWNRLGSVVLTAVFGAGVILAGCSDKKAAEPAPTNGSSGANQSYTVKHAMGETPIPKPPQRVVILTNEGTEALLALGIKPVGAVKSWVGDPWYDHIKADMQGVKNVGTESQPNIEDIAALKPDLIIGNKMRIEKVYDQLSKIAPTVYSTELRGDWKINFKLYAEAVGKKAEGEKIMADFDKRLADFKTKAGDKLKQKVSLVRFMPATARIYYNDTFAGVIFKQAGIARPDKQNKETFADDVTKERIPDMEGDLLFYFTYETGDGKASKMEEDWVKDPLWNNLNVVKNKKAFKVSDTVWNTAGGVKAANLLIDDLYRVFEVKP
ncbi:ABC transporter substrate-binding protein [Paenibacillus ginsengarvi]|uniref:Iron-siderophore ABC transporter substrate-binding protein n=1 Tax=Paenibacillus ginsengarvi TaxID=400777 RepID=A0A3B0CJ47_9BACL|nr:iron-siderophore ABC transporter substrate-binding protein [Paenibacillus ginsengarvi]RKN84728.1 iron-siderophore ABC transporter substrate-binding protein [Paenibacillus ginsengarvi]